MEISIIGLPKSGKTTVFNALTKGKADISAYAPSGLAPNIRTAKVQDQRLQVLKRIFEPQKITSAEVKYVDIAGTARSTDNSPSISGQLLNHLSNAHALLHVVRAFEDDKVPHVDTSINPKRDIDTMDMELAFSDLAIIEKRLSRIEISIKGAKTTERDIILKEKALLEEIKTGLEKDMPIWRQELNSQEIRSLSDYQFLTAKPMLVVINIGESQLVQSSSIETDIRAACNYPQFEVAALCGKLEMELTELGDTDAEEFRKTLELTEPALDRIIRLSYNLLGLISFFTTVSSELKAWTIQSGTTALQAAGKIHTDIEKGFIRAEVISFDDLVKCGSLSEARKRGTLRLEGKTYTINDGDIITFLFNT